MWEFLSDPDNQKTVAFYGGGAAIAISGVWTAFLALRKTPDPKKEPPKPVGRSANAGNGIAAAGNIAINGDVAITPPAAKWPIVVVAVAGFIALGVGVALPGSGDCISGSVVSGGDISARDITLNGAGADIDC